MTTAIPATDTSAPESGNAFIVAEPLRVDSSTMTVGARSM